jgi:hypothetical protein
MPPPEAVASKKSKCDAYDDPPCGSFDQKGNIEIRSLSFDLLKEIEQQKDYEQKRWKIFSQADG